MTLKSQRNDSSQLLGGRKAAKATDYRKRFPDLMPLGPCVVLMKEKEELCEKQSYKESKLVVSVKRNPSEHTSAQCGNQGYRNIKPWKTSTVPRLRPGETHTLRAEMEQQGLCVFVDNREVWQGDIGLDSTELDGPVGIRFDNAQLEFDLKARESKDSRRPWPCRPAVGLDASYHLRVSPEGREEIFSLDTVSHRVCAMGILRQHPSEPAQPLCFVDLASRWS